ncbi:Thymidylate synthase domain protein (fragment) [Neisseria gonorrhoeae]|uniref:Thymidylate synthase domain protein n=1 Tax=Neisseria gonorrhoeae TaxID=485 RepID=A0AB74EUR7_NEIGO
MSGLGCWPEMLQYVPFNLMKDDDEGLFGLDAPRPRQRYGQIRPHRYGYALRIRLSDAF